MLWKELLSKPAVITKLSVTSSCVSMQTHKISHKILPSLKNGYKRKGTDWRVTKYNNWSRYWKEIKTSHHIDVTSRNIELKLVRRDTLNCHPIVCYAILILMEMAKVLIQSDVHSLLLGYGAYYPTRNAKYWYQNL